MKNLLIKLVLATLCFSVMLFALTGCDRLGDIQDIIGGTSSNEGCVHKYSDWELFSDGECQERIYKRVCSKCHNLEWKEGTDADHVWEEKTVESTCSTEGGLMSVCSKCEKREIINPLPLKEHSWEETRIDSSCTTQGYIMSVCRVCRESKIKEYLPLNNHNYILNYNFNYHWYYCYGCGQTINSESHNFNSNDTCSICNYKIVTQKQVIEIWVSEREGVSSLIAKQIEQFLEANPEYAGLYTFNIEGVTEADASSQIIADIYCAPDIYCFAQDQLARLVQAGALAAPEVDISELIKSNNDPSSVAAVSFEGNIFAYPLTSNNGYFMYYDTSIITNPNDLAQIVADCEAAKKNIYFELENAWYTASFFFATGCHSNWTMNSEGKFTSVDDNFNSNAGLVAMKGMQIVTKSPYYNNSSNNYDNLGILISGMWMEDAVKDYLGDRYGVTDLPSFTVDGETYHLGSFSCNTLMGVKPQADSKKEAFLSKLANYLTSAECQLERYEIEISKNYDYFIPSNLEVQASDAVTSNKAHTALILQSNYATPQGLIHGDWWDFAQALGKEAKNAKNEDELRVALDMYSSSLRKIFRYNDYQESWSVIGSIEDTDWQRDYSMTKISNGIWQSPALNLKKGDEFLLRYGGAWNIQAGKTNDKTGTTATGYYVKTELDGSNLDPIVVENSGTYIIRFEWDETSHIANILLIPVS